MDFGVVLQTNPPASRTVHLAKLAEQNMAMFKAAASAFLPGAEPSGPNEPEAPQGSDIDALRKQMEAMQKRLDALDK